MATVTLLETIGLSKNFEGLQAVDDVELVIPAGEIRAVIGPNGAGKTTLVSLVSGRLKPTQGSIRFKGEDITGLRAWDRVGRGIVYTFQVTSIYANLSCYENVALAVQRRMMGGLRDRLVLAEERVTKGIELALSRVGLADEMHRQAGELPYGHQRLLEVSMGLALEPELLILDEPTQGLALEEISGFCDLIRAISKRATVLLIEHNMSVVLELAELITVMDKGMVIAEGTPSEIERDPVVQRAYLGTDAAA
ncbi:MAG: ABC transporter ATP-binding protein [Alphaproteobacteria bacterium]|nr:ABC transporter ATP-binding protein [Alphaproteobacteria bacterium]